MALINSDILVDSSIGQKFDTRLPGLKLRYRWCLLDLLSGGSGENPHLYFFQFLQVTSLPRLRAAFLCLQSQQGSSLWPLFPSQVFPDHSRKRFSLLRMDVIRVGPPTWQLRVTSPSKIHNLAAIHRFWVLGCGHLWEHPAYWSSKWSLNLFFHIPSLSPQAMAGMTCGQA